MFPLQVLSTAGLTLYGANAPMQRMRAFLSALLLMMLIAPALPAAAAEPLPDDATLESSGARVGEIIFRIGDIFDLDDPSENRALFRLANRLHVNTREATVRADLLFRSGEPYSRRLLEETERILRQRDYLREPQVRPVSYHDGLVDIEVVTHDVWTLQFGPSFSRSGGTNAFSLDFEDVNFLGRGKKIGFSFGSDVDRDVASVTWFDPHVLGGRWQDSLSWTQASDGHLYSAALWRPFYSLDVRRSYGLEATDSALTESRYRLGDIYDGYSHERRSYRTYVGWSTGLRRGFTRRTSAGWRFDDDRFTASPTGATLAPLPANRTLSYPYLQLDLIRDDFRTARNFDQIDRTEDLQFGLSGSAVVGWAGESWGSDREAAIMETGVSYGRELGPAQRLFLAVNGNGRLEQGEGRDLHASLSAAWYMRTSASTLLHVKATVAGGSELDLDHYYELGGDNGLRGYPLRYQQGTGMALLKIEQRLFTSWSLWELLDVGAAAFIDAGRTWGNNPIGAPQLGWLRDAGIGLRLGNSRSSLGKVIHIDIATPLDGEERLERLQLLIGTRATF